MINIIALISGILVGAIGVGLIVLWVMRNQMVVAHQSSASFDETLEKIEAIVPKGDDGWGFPIKRWNMMDTFKAKNQIPQGVKRLEIFFVCNAGLAKVVLSHNVTFAGMMPCSWALYEKEDGSVWISKMNIPLMAKMFKGEIKKTMTKVGQADEEFLKAIL